MKSLKDCVAESLKSEFKSVNEAKTPTKEVLELGEIIKKALAEGKVVLGETYNDYDGYEIVKLDYKGFLKLCKNDDVREYDIVDWKSFIGKHIDHRGNYEPFFKKIGYKPSPMLDVYMLYGPDFTNYEIDDEEYEDPEYFDSFSAIIIIDPTQAKRPF